MDRPSFFQLVAEIEALRSAWAERHGKRERGARVSLAGYTYQFLVVLLQTVEGWLKSPKNARADRHIFHEYLADALELTDDGLICVTQIKVRQSSTLLRRALEDLWRIYEVASEGKPHLLDRLRFRVLAAECDLIDVEAAVSRWCEEKAASGGQPVEPFRARLTVAREAHPEDRLFALLANAKDLRATSPQTYIDRWLGQLMAAAGAAAESEALRQAEHRILDDLVTLYNRRNEEPSAVYIWTEEDRPPATVVPGRFLAGRQPRVGDLRDGCFANLAVLYDDLHGSARAWIEQIAAGSADRYRLPLLWLQGRSGSGKSVALLHLLARLHEDGHFPIFWLGQRLSLLPHAMRLAIETSRQGKAPLIGLDDPYTPSVQDSARRDWEEAFAELQAYQDAAEEFSGPVLVVCCGPTEQASQFMADFSDDVEMRRLQVPHEQEREISELRRWYKERTGQEPPEVGNDRVLLVQLFFEWQHGEPLPEFAARFRKRVEGVDRSNALFDRLSRVFALNRLYVGYPPAAVPAGLSPAQEGLLRQLESDEHFGVDVTSERSGLWWLHPHLANAIYDAWYLPEPRNAPARREHLRAGIEDSLAHGKRPSERTAPLWAIARALRTDAEIDLSQRLQATDIRELLTRCYAQVGARHGGRLPLELIPVWIDLKFLVPALALGLDPVEEGIHQVSADHLRESGLRLTCHKLLQHLTEMPALQAGRVVDVVLDLLQAAPAWYEWLPIAWDVLQRVRDDRLWPLVAGWVAAHPAHPSAPRLLERCLRIAPGDPHLVATAERLLPSARADFAWGDVGLRLIEGASGPSVSAAVLDWVQANRRERGVCFLLGALLKRRVSPALQWAHEWLPLWYREASANFVLEPLLTFEGRRERIADWSLAWLDVGRGDPSFLMQRLLELFPEDERVLTRIKAWLEETSPNHRSWGFVWMELRRVLPDDVEPLATGRAWLAKTDPKHGSWNFVWQELRRALPEDSELLVEGRTWLEKADPNHSGWNFVWNKLWKALPGDPELLTRGRTWLEKADPNHGDWNFLWQKLRRALPDDAELLTQGKSWLGKADPNHGGWSLVWQELRKALPDDIELLAQGRAWLERADPEHGGWSFVWNKLRKALPEDPELLARGRTWLEKADPNHSGWNLVWQELRKAFPDDTELLAEGRAWLEKVEPDHSAWSLVWLELRAMLPADAELLAEGRNWLARADPNHAGWRVVWQELLKALADDSELVTEGRDWLARVEPDHGGWGFVWLELRKVLPDDQELLAEGRKWLAKADPNHGSWGFVWLELWQVLPGDKELLDEGRKWLAKADPNHGSWGFVWLELWQVLPGDKELLDDGRHWLAKADPNHGGWGFIWLNLQRVLPDDQDLLSKGRDWLTKADPNHGSWGFVWQDLRKLFPTDEELLAEGRNWLAKADPNNTNWGFVWPELQRALPANEELLAEGRNWLAKADPNHGGWGFVWPELQRALPADEELLAEGRNWLAKADPNHGGWGFVWRGLRTALTDDAELLAEGLEWLAKVEPRHSNWNFVWQELRKAVADHPELLSAGQAWLAKVDLNHGGWGHVWLEFWKALPHDSELLAQGRAWLGKVDPNHGSWGYVWEAIRKAHTDDADLLALGRAWLTRADPNHEGWNLVWRHLRKVFPDDVELLAEGRSWLSKVDPQHGSWGYAWVELRRTLPDDAELLAQGRAWLAEAHPKKVEGVWVMLRKQTRTPEALDLGRLWLTETQGQFKKWPRIWREVWNLNPGDPPLLSLGCSWLRDHDPEGSWFEVYGDMSELLGEGSDLVLKAHGWLDWKELSHRSWPYMWRGLLRFYAHDPNFLMMGREWLAQADFDDRTWPYLWQELWDRRPGDPMLMDFGKHWLERHAEEISWPFVWEKLYCQAGGNGELSALALRWLGENNPTHKQWAFVWSTLRNRAPESTELMECGRRWLEQVPQDQPGREQIEAAVLSGISGREDPSGSV